MKIRMRTIFAHPDHGALDAGKVIDLPPAIAKRLVKEGHAEFDGAESTGGAKAEKAIEVAAENAAGAEVEDAAADGSEETAKAKK
jgi:hypothetical protein